MSKNSFQLENWAAGEKWYLSWTWKEWVGFQSVEMIRRGISGGRNSAGKGRVVGGIQGVCGKN